MTTKLMMFAVAASLLAAPAHADKFKLSDYKTVAIQPVIAATNSRDLFASQLAASASQLTVDPTNAAAAKKANAALFDGRQGFGFAGKAQGVDIALLMIGDAFGVLPGMIKIHPDDAKKAAAEYAPLLAKIEGKVDARITKALGFALQGAAAGEFEVTMKAVVLAMAVSADSITKGSERAHGYMAAGLYAGMASVFALGKLGSPSLAELGAPLVMYFEQDAALGGADRTVAAQLKVIAAEMGKPTPELAKIIAADQAMNAIKPD